MDIDELTTRRNSLAKIQKALEEAKAKKNALLQKVTLSEDYLALEALVKLRQSEVDAVTTIVKMSAVEIYNVDQSSKEVIPGVSIRDKKEFIYDRNKAKDYAVKHSLFLVLDEKSFEEHVKKNRDKEPELEFVEIKTTPTATISSDLSKFLPPDPPEAG